MGPREGAGNGMVTDWTEGLQRAGVSPLTDDGLSVNLKNSVHRLPSALHRTVLSVTRGCRGGRDRGLTGLPSRADNQERVKTRLPDLCKILLERLAERIRVNDSN